MSSVFFFWILLILMFQSGRTFNSLRLYWPNLLFFIRLLFNFSSEKTLTILSVFDTQISIENRFRRRFQIDMSSFRRRGNLFVSIFVHLLLEVILSNLTLLFYWRILTNEKRPHQAAARDELNMQEMREEVNVIFFTKT